MSDVKSVFCDRCGCGYGFGLRNHGDICGDHSGGINTRNPCPGVCRSGKYTKRVHALQIASMATEDDSKENGSNPSQVAVTELLRKLSAEPGDEIADALLFAGGAELHKLGLPVGTVNIIIDIVRDVAQRGPSS